MPGVTPEVVKRSKVVKTQGVRQQGDPELTEPDSDDDSLLGDDPPDCSVFQPIGKLKSQTCLAEERKIMVNDKLKLVAFSMYFKWTGLAHARRIVKCKAVSAELSKSPESLSAEELIKRRLNNVKALFSSYKVQGSVHPDGSVDHHIASRRS